MNGMRADHRLHLWVRWFLLVCVTGLGLLVLWTVQPARSASSEVWVLIDRLDGPALPEDLRVVEDYGAFVLAVVEPPQLAALESRYQIEALPQRTRIELPGVSFDSQEGEPAIAPELSAAADDPYYLLQFIGPIQASWLPALEKQGVEFLGFHPHFTYLVRLEPGLAAEIEQLPYVQWLGQYHPAYRLPAPQAVQAALEPDGRARLTLRLFPGADLEAVLAQVLAAGGEIEWLATQGSLQVRLLAQPAQLDELARLAGVYLVEAYEMPQLDNERAAQVTRTWDLWRQSRNGLLQDLMGQGQVAGMVDSGLDDNDTTPLINDFYDFTAGVQTTRIQAALAGSGCARPCTCYAQDDATSSGHGTHVAGSIVGNGYNALLQRGLESQAQSADPNFDYAFGVGQAPEARIVFSYVAGNYRTTPGTLCGLGATYTTWLDVYNAGARNANNSWGSSTNTYGGDALDADELMWVRQDYLLVTSAGNAGPGWQTIGQPGTGKNLLTVGAAGNHRSTWGASSDTAAQLTDFSSRGPVAAGSYGSDGRFKPDIVAPGADILSTRSTFIANGTVTLWGNEPGDGDGDGQMDYWWSGGTSMSSPLVTGAATVVRDYMEDIQGFGSTTPPSAALIKALLANGAVDQGYGYETFGSAPYGGRNLQGWGMLNLEQSILPQAPRSFFLDDFTNISNSTKQSTRGLNSSGDYVEYTFTVSESSEPLKVTLSWTDAQAGTSGYAVNNLNLLVIAPDGSQYRGNVFNGAWSVTDGSYDAVNNTEAVYLQTPAAGTWTVRVTAANIGSGVQPYALVVSGGLGVQPAYSRTCVGTTPDCAGRLADSALSYFPSLRALSTSEEHLAAGSAFSTSFELTNWGSSSDTLSLTYAASDLSGASASGISVTFDPAGPFSLAAGASQIVTATVKVAAAVANGPYDLQVTAVSAGNGAQQAAVIGLNVIERPDLFNETRVVADSGPQFAADLWASGQNLWTVYMSGQSHNNSETHIYAACSADGGQTWTAGVQLDAADGRYYLPPAIAGRSDGGSVTVVWLPVDSSAVYARTWTRSDGCSGSWGSIRTVSSYGSGYIIFDPAVVYDNHGDILVAWLHYYSSGTIGIYASVSTDSGSSWSARAAVPDASGSAVHRYPAFALDSANNDVWMAYSNQYSGADRNIYVKRWDGDTNAWAAAGTNHYAVAATSERENRPGIAYIPETGALWVAWTRYPGYSSPTPQLYYARSSGTLPAVSFPTTYGPYGGRIPEYLPPALTGDGSSTFIAYLAYHDSYRGANVYLLQVPAAGGVPALSYQATASQDSAALYAGGNAGQARLAWASTTLNGKAFSGPTLLYSKNPPNSESPVFTSLGTAQVLFNQAEDFDLYLAQARPAPVDPVYADTNGVCAGNLPCYLSFQGALDAVDSGGTVYVYPRQYAEDVNLNKEAAVYVLGDTTVQSLSISAGTLYAPAGTLTLSGDFSHTAGSFQHGSGTLRLAGSAPQVLGGSDTFYHLTIDNPAGASLGGDPLINGTLTLADGRLDLGAHTLSLGTEASLAGSFSASAMIVADGGGALRKYFAGPGSLIFPLGDVTGTAEYSPASLDFTSGTFAAGAYAQVSLVDGKHPANAADDNYLTRYWTVTQSGISAFSCTTSFQYLQADVVGTEISIAGARHDGSNWYFLSALNAETNQFGAAVSGFSDFSGIPGTPTAVTVVAFEAWPAAGGVRLSWESQVEVEVLGYNLYRAEGLTGEPVRLNLELIPPGQGGTLFGYSYAFLDASAQTGVLYQYWLEVVTSLGSEQLGPVGIELRRIWLPTVVELGWSSP